MSEQEKQTQESYNQEPYNQEPYPYPQESYPQEPYDQGAYYQEPYSQQPYQQPPYQQGPYQQPPYQQMPYEMPPKPPKQQNGFATASFICGIFSLLNLCCFAFPLAIVMGVLAISFAVISKKDMPMSGIAITGIVLGVLGVLLGVGEFFYSLALSNLLKDPANAAIINELIEQLEQQMYPVQ